MFHKHLFSHPFSDGYVRLRA